MTAMTRVRSGRTLLWFPDRADEPVLRLTAAGVVLGLLAAFAFDLAWVVPVLAAGFFARSLAGPRLSPLALAARWIAARLALRSRRVRGAPKQIAAAVGGTMLAAASVALFAGAERVGWSLASAVALFASLEALFAVCVVCKVYARVIPCPDCDGEEAGQCYVDGGGI